MFSSELKKGSMEMLILALLEVRARHGYEIGKLIESRSDGKLKFALPSLYPALLRLESRGWIKGAMGRKDRGTAALFLPANGQRAEDTGPATGSVGSSTLRPSIR